MTTAAMFVALLCLAMMAPSSARQLSPHCKDTLQKCGDLYQVFTPKPSGSPGLNVAYACKDTEGTLTCYGECLAAIKGHAVDGQGVRTREYICDPSRRDMVTAAYKSQCFRDGSMSAYINGSLPICSKALMRNKMVLPVIGQMYVGDNTNVQKLCRLVDEFKECLMIGIKKFCTTDAQKVASGLIDLSIHDFLYKPLKQCFT